MRSTLLPLTALTLAGVAETPDDQLFYPLCLGYIGTEATIAFHSFAKSFLSFRTSGWTGGRPANFGGISIIALLMRTATGLRSLA